MEAEKVRSFVSFRLILPGIVTQKAGVFLVAVESVDPLELPPEFEELPELSPEDPPEPDPLPESVEGFPWV